MSLNTEQRRARFMDAARGLTTHATGCIMTEHGTGGINWRGSPKGRMADAYAAGTAHGSRVREAVIVQLRRAPRKGVPPVPPPAPPPPRETERTTHGELEDQADAIDRLRNDIGISQHGLKGRARINFKLGLLALEEAALRIRLAKTEL